MPTYLRPGVFFEEVSFPAGPRPADRRLLPPVHSDSERLTRTWTAEKTHVAFVGVTSRGPVDTPIWLDSWGQFEGTFGEPATVGEDRAALPLAVAGFFANGGRSCVVVRVDETAGYHTDAFVGEPGTQGLGALEALNDVSLVCAPDLWVLHRSGVMDREQVQAVQMALIAHCEWMGDRLAILDCPPGLTPQGVREWRVDYAGFDTSFATLYYPWIKVYDPARGGLVVAPPSGHVAGVYARTDAVRGFHHSPANQPIAAALAVEAPLRTVNALDLLNPVGVNAIVASPGRGLLVWGNRTLSSNPQRRFVHQRRVISFIGRNLTRATEWAVFERADDETLGPRVAADVREFLLLLWRSGALWGHSPEAAFSIRLHPDLEDNIVVVECEVALEKYQMSGFNLVYNLG